MPKKTASDQEKPVKARVSLEMYEWLKANCGREELFGSIDHAINRALKLLRHQIERGEYEAQVEEVPAVRNNDGG